ncbi:MAG: prepilin-type N-terminal cleavage/methylation domain-containing protein [Planctomycetota bacterium]
MNIQKSANRRVGGFTLIELLVVIAIIALLIAILLPSLDAARKQAKQNACLSHIKNIASSSRVYEADDPSGWGIPVHPLQYKQNASNPTFIGAYEWGGKSGIGREGFTNDRGILGSKYGTFAGFGPPTRPMNRILYPGGFPDFAAARNRTGATEDTKLELEIFKCPGDDGPPRGAHCKDWIDDVRTVPSYDWFGNSYSCNMFMVGHGSGEFWSNSPYLRPTSRVPTPARTLYYEENVGRWAWGARKEQVGCEQVINGPGIDPGPTKAVRGWHGKDWSYNRSFVDAHAEFQRIYIEGTEDREGYAHHYRSEQISAYPPFEGEDDQGGSDYESYKCIIVRGDGWQKDTLPNQPVKTGLQNPNAGRPSYEDCVDSGGG